METLGEGSGQGKENGEGWTWLLRVHFMFESATGNYGELNGFQNIFIADASILPTSLGVNPQETISCLVMRNIDFFLNKNKHI